MLTELYRELFIEYELHVMFIEIFLTQIKYIFLSTILSGKIRCFLD